MFVSLGFVQNRGCYFVFITDEEMVVADGLVRVLCRAVWLCPVHAAPFPGHLLGHAGSRNPSYRWGFVFVSGVHFSAFELLTASLVKF